MRKYVALHTLILAFSVISLFTMAAIHGCRKIDREDKAGSSGLTESRFFNQHTSSEPLVQAIAGFMKRKNVKTNFVTTTISRIGYPRWDKSRTVSWQKRAGFVNSDDDTTDITYIPFVRDSQNYVNAAWIIKTTPTDTAFGYLCDWQYKDYGFDSTQSSWNARNVFHLFTRMDKDVFDRNQFRIIDEELLTQPEKDYLNSENLDFDSAVVVYSMEPSQSGSFNNLLMPVTICDDIFTCIRVRTPDDDPLPARQSLNQVVPGCPSGTIPISSTICTEVWVYIPSSGGGSDDGPGGDPGSGGGGGSTPPDCPSGTGRNNLTDDPCGPGWIPIEELPSIDDPCDKVDSLKGTADFRNAFTDLKNRTTESREYGYKVGRDGVYYFVEGPPNGVDGVSFYISSMVHFLLHNHFAGGLPIFSGGDFELIAGVFENNFLSTDQFFFGLTTDSGSYVLTIENPQEFETFITNYIDPSIESEKFEKTYDAYKIGKYANHETNIVEFVNLMNDLETGVGLLKANADFTQFSKVGVTNNQLILTPCN